MLIQGPEDVTGNDIDDTDIRPADSTPGWCDGAAVSLPIADADLIL
jgi:hypothetical protein